MRKSIVILLIALLVISLVGRQASAEAGGWTPAADFTVTGERQALFDKGMEIFTNAGVNFVPVAYLGSQVVAGTNHVFLAQTTLATPKVQATYYLIYLFEDLQGNVTILNMVTQDIAPREKDAAAESKTTKPETVSGGEVQVITGVDRATTSDGQNRKKAEETIELNTPLVIVDDAYCTVSIVSKYETDLEVGYRALVENKTDFTISVDFDNVSVDGFMNIVTNKNTTVTEGNKGYVWFSVVKSSREDISSRSPNVDHMDDLKNVKGTMKVYSKNESKLKRLDTLKISID